MLLCHEMCGMSLPPRKKSLRRGRRDWDGRRQVIRFGAVSPTRSYEKRLYLPHAVVFGPQLPVARAEKVAVSDWHRFTLRLCLPSSVVRWLRRMTHSPCESKAPRVPHRRRRRAGALAQLPPASYSTKCRPPRGLRWGDVFSLSLTRPLFLPCPLSLVVSSRACVHLFLGMRPLALFCRHDAVFVDPRPAARFRSTSPRFM